MDWLTILNQIFQVAIIPLIGAITCFLVAFINAKRKELEEKTENDKKKEYLEMLNNIINDCVIATTQTYVESLKNKNAFDADAQKVALNKTYMAVIDILTEDAKECLIKIVGDLNKYILNKIEAEVAITKRIYF